MKSVTGKIDSRTVRSSYRILADSQPTLDSDGGSSKDCLMRDIIFEVAGRKTTPTEYIATATAVGAEFSEIRASSLSHLVCGAVRLERNAIPHERQRMSLAFAWVERGRRSRKNNRNQGMKIMSEYLILVESKRPALKREKGICR